MVDPGPRFQLDENISGPTFVAECNARRSNTASAFPSSMRGKNDPDVIEYSRSKSQVLVSTDRTIVYDVEKNLYGSYPGFIIISTSDTNPRTMTAVLAAKILGAWKDRITDWPELSFRNSVVELNERFAQVWHIADAQLVHVGMVVLDEPELDKQLVRLIGDQT